MSLLELDIIRKRHIDEKTTQLEFKADGKDDKYEIKKIQDNVV